MPNVLLINGDPTQGGVDGSLVSTDNPVQPDLLTTGADAETNPIRLALRTNPGYQRNGPLAVTPQGAHAVKWALAPDENGAPGTFGAWGAALVLANVLTARNLVFWVKARVTADESYPTLYNDLGVTFSVPDDAYLLAPVGRSLAMGYVEASGVGRSLGQVYTVRVIVGRSADQSYGVTGIIGRSLSQPYGMGGQATRSAALPYGINAAVGRSSALPYTVKSAVGRSAALPYNVAPITITEYGTTSASPMEVCMGPDGNVWFVFNSTAGKIGKMTPAGTITEYTVATNFIGTSICTDGTDMFISGYISGGNYCIYKVTTGGTVTRIYDDITGIGALGMVVGPDGNLWFTSPFSGLNGGVSKITKAGASLTTYNFSDTSANPQYIASDGTNLWVTLYGVQKVAKVTTGGTITTYMTTTANPYRIIYHAAAGKLFIASSGGVIPVTPGTGAMGTTITGSGAGFMCAGPDGNLWTGLAAGTVLRKVDLSNANAVTNYTTPSAVWGVVGDLSNGRLFYAAYASNKIGKAVL